MALKHQRLTHGRFYSSYMWPGCGVVVYVCYSCYVHINLIILCVQLHDCAPSDHVMKQGVLEGGAPSDHVMREVPLVIM